MYSLNKIVTTSAKSVLITSKYISIKTASGVCRSCCRTQAMYARLSTFDFRCHNSSLNVSDCCGVRLCSIEFDYVRLLDRSITERSLAFDLQTFLVSSIKFDYRTQWNPIERLGLITERSISYAGDSIFSFPPLFLHLKVITLISSLVCCK